MMLNCLHTLTLPSLLILKLATMLKRLSLSPRVDDEFATSDTRQMIKFVLSFLIKILRGKLEKVISNSPLPTRSQKGN